MKKMLKMTLFKKTFLIIFCGLLCVEGIHVFLDVKQEISAIIKNHVTYNDNIAHKLNELEIENRNKSLTLDESKTLMYNAFKDQSGYFSIISSNFNINEKPLYEFINGQFQEIPYIIKGSNGHPVDLFGFSKEDIDNIENYIMNNNRLLKIYYQIKDNPDGFDEATYLSINNEINIGKINNEETLYEDYIKNYTSFNMYYYFNTWKNEVGELLLRENYLNDLQKISIELYDNYKLSSGLTRIGVKRIDNDLCISEKAQINIGPHKYFMNFTKIYYNAFDNVLHTCLTSKGTAYTIAIIMSLSMSLFIAYMVTYRIRRMYKATDMIEKGSFDFDLKDNSKDEIGDLSRKMNAMSVKLENTIKQLNEEIEHVKELEALRKDFINQFTHEMKTPLGVINGYSELIEITEDENEKQRYLTLINQETSRINELVLSMLKLSRLEAGKVELYKEDIDLEYIVVGAVDEFEVLLKKNNIKVIINCIDNNINGDKEQVKTVIRNFISNAIKHTDTKIVVTIDKGVKVFNEGKPIDEDKLNGIWYTFVTHDKTGTGLGLAICRSILELHNYQYGVTNKENGVEFYFFE